VQNAAIDATSLTNGLYLLRVQAGTNTALKRFVVQH